MPVTEEFNKLLDDLKKESELCSNTPLIEEFPIFKQVISHGMSIVLAILLKLRKEEGDATLHLALEKITGENPQVANPRNLKEIGRWWLEWGFRKKYLRKWSARLIPNEIKGGEKAMIIDDKLIQEAIDLAQPSIATISSKKGRFCDGR